MNFKSESRRRRLALEEAYQRENIFKARTLDLIQEGVNRRDPIFVSAFTSAKQASFNLDRQLYFNTKINAVKQKADAIRLHVESQSEISKLLNKHRRYLQPDFIEGVDFIEDSNNEKQDQLNDILSDIEVNIDTSNQECLNETDEALLTKWMLERAPRVSMMTSNSFFNQEEYNLPKPGGGNFMLKSQIQPSTQITPQNNFYNQTDIQSTPTACHSTLQPFPKNSQPITSNLNKEGNITPTMEDKVSMTTVGLKQNEFLNREEEHPLIDRGEESLESWLGGLPPLKNEDVQVCPGTPSINGPIF
ncbi:tegument protein UL14 [Canid alphaherpesvirus 1]|uniref:Tegument protein UL14 n=1 Tax=Canid alphaherpesvirus 1 TaxID=170325 RepID=A0A7T7DDX0_9ALPH|nr:tegument protein UL14 [Canid alphaherpesvirus 1]QQL08761.1 tegument protein UL14 [Canid alphaherpesvirus 1]